MTISSSFKRIIPSVFKKYLRNKLGVPSLQSSFENLKHLGFTPNTVLDIGAYEGNWSMDFKKIFPDASILMLEGQTSKESILKKVSEKTKGLEYQIALLGARESSVNFNIYDTASSILLENNKTGAVVERRELVSLDKILKDSIFNQPDLIKIDTQGYELEILKGGEFTLKNTKAALLEVSFLDVYKDCPLVTDVFTFMSEHDFLLYDICSLMRRPLDSALYQSDFLFVKNDSVLRINKSWN